MPLMLDVNWAPCARVGCMAVRWMSCALCLEHLDDAALAQSLATLRPGDDVDLRATILSRDRFREVCRALTPSSQAMGPRFGSAKFDYATFAHGGSFGRAEFAREATFREAIFKGLAQFEGVNFANYANFTGAQFENDALFYKANFTSGSFNKAHFMVNARFTGARFTARSNFTGAIFEGEAGFGETSFTEPARFDCARFGTAIFSGAIFDGKVEFAKTIFTDTARFSGASFCSPADFSESQFEKKAEFTSTSFAKLARFPKAQFKSSADFSLVEAGGGADFTDAHFCKAAYFTQTQFDGGVFFQRACFDAAAAFMEVKVGARAFFTQACFKGAWDVQLICTDSVDASLITIGKPSRLQIAASKINLTGAVFTGPSVLAARFAAIDLTDINADAPLTVASHPSPFVSSPLAREIDEQGLVGDSRAKIVSVTGLDAAKLVLTDVDLSSCVFSGALHLDQIRLEGRPTFAAPPRRRPRQKEARVRRWTRRKVLAEEAAWRASSEQKSARSRAGWARPVHLDSAAPTPSPAQLAALYRQLRKALEDGKDTPEAADFYYGEMEARRHDREGTPRGERWLLHAYWLLSGYALRASRAIGFLAATAAVTFLFMLTLGLPDNQLDPQITGTIPSAGGQVTLADSTPDPQLTLPLGQRFTLARADQAGLVVVNSVIFRSADATLTKPGTWVEILSRIGEPVLLGFAAVAARGRVQR